MREFLLRGATARVRSGQNEVVGLHVDGGAGGGGVSFGGLPVIFPSVYALSSSVATKTLQCLQLYSRVSVGAEGDCGARQDRARGLQ